MDWIAYCCVCGELAKMPNGTWAQGIAEEHGKRTGHRTLVGYESCPGEERQPDETRELAMEVGKAIHSTTGAEQRAPQVSPNPNVDEYGEPREFTGSF